MDYFKDESIFQGIKECETPCGRMRFEEQTGTMRNKTIYRVSVLVGDAWHQVARILSNSKSCKDLFEFYIKEEED